MMFLLEKVDIYKKMLVVFSQGHVALAALNWFYFAELCQH